MISDYTSSDYGVGVTGKLLRGDINNPYGEDNIVHISVYDRVNNKYHNSKVICTYDKREDNKKLVIDEVIKMLLSL